MVKLIVSDIDGTIVPEGTALFNKDYIKVIKKLVSKNIAFAFASGRHYTSMKKMFNELLNDVYFLSDNGSTIIKNDKVLFKKKFDEKLAIDIIEFSKEINIPVVVSNDVGYYIDSNNELLHKILYYGYENVGGRVEDLKTTIKNCSKITAFCEENVFYYYNKYLEKYGENFDIAISGKNWVDITIKDSNKGFGVESLQHILNVSIENTIVFGDNFNDIPMFFKAKNSFVVDNAVDEVKKYATDIIENYDYNGVLLVLQKYYDNIV